MKWLPFFLLLLCVGCQTPADSSNQPENSEQPGAFGGETSEPDNLDERDRVTKFRGVEMPRLLERLEAGSRDRWTAVRKYVHPAPKSPRQAGYEWPPVNWDELSAPQQAWRDYMRWPEHIRNLLQQEQVVRDGEVVQQAWDSPQVRERLARYGRLYRLVYEFQSAGAYQGEHSEERHWKDFAKAMLEHGDDGRQMLVSNMVMALTSPDPGVITRAQDALVSVGEPAIDDLCAALWTGHNQLVRVEFEDGRFEYRVQTNAKFPQYIVDCLFRIGPTSVRRAWYELKNGPKEGTSWRFRKYFIDLLGMFRDPGSVKPLESELDEVKIAELDRDALQRGEQVVDERATDHANFVYREYILQALGDIGAPEGMRAVVRIWKLDESHENGAAEAVFKISGRRVRSIQEAREVARGLKVDLQGH